VSPAPLVETPNLRMPPGGTAEFAHMRDGAPIRIATWSPPDARGAAIILPGATEFIEQFGETIGEQLSRGRAVGILDWRGQGLSHRPLKDYRKRHIDDFATYVADFREIASGGFAKLPRPWHLLCQSMGGHIGALILQAHITDFVSAVLMAPMLAIITKPWPLPVARFLTRAFCAAGQSDKYVLGGGPKSDFTVASEHHLLTHDAERYSRTIQLIAAEPKLDIGSPTFGWLEAAFRSMDALAQPQAARAITTPTLAFACGEDAVVVNSAIERFTSRLAHGRLARLAGARHAILLETNAVRTAFWREYDAFVADLRLAAK
jgi:lysophospholipase